MRARCEGEERFMSKRQNIARRRERKRSQVLDQLYIVGSQLRPDNTAPAVCQRLKETEQRPCLYYFFHAGISLAMPTSASRHHVSSAISPAELKLNTTTSGEMNASLAFGFMSTYVLATAWDPWTVMLSTSASMYARSRYCCRPWPIASRPIGTGCGDCENTLETAFSANRDAADDASPSLTAAKNAETRSTRYLSPRSSCGSAVQSFTTASTSKYQARDVTRPDFGSKTSSVAVGMTVVLPVGGFSMKVPLLVHSTYSRM
mmetsp:Transcript_3553/g.10712  ORF Transcript_3553/g.10712 Transcript_3553/m.10712 type:complete len:261 (+) Transcript_3553:394-1176(+)